MNRFKQNRGKIAETPNEYQKLTDIICRKAFDGKLQKRNIPIVKVVRGLVIPDVTTFPAFLYMTSFFAL